MPKFTVRFFTPAEYAVIEIKASTSAKALARARLLAENPAGIEFTSRGSSPIDTIQVVDRQGDHAADWISPSLRVQLAAPALLEAAKLVIERWSQGDLADAVRQLDAAVAEAEE